MPVTNPFQQINAALPPLVPAPPPDLGFNPADMDTSAPAQMPQGKKPQVFGPSPQDRQETVLGGRLEQDYQKDLHPFGTPENHPGVMGKIAHALSWATGGPNRRLMEESGIESKLNKLAELQSQNAYRGAETGKDTEETAEMPGKTASEEALQSAETNEKKNGKWTPATGWQGPNGEPMEYNEVSGTYRPAPGSAGAKLQEKPAQSKGMEHVAGTVNGKPVEANFHPDTGEYTDPDTGAKIMGFKPPPQQPNYGQLILPTKTATYLDANTGVPTEFQWNEKTNRYDIPVGQSATGGYGHEAAQAGAVERAGTQVIQDLEANKADLGTLGAWVAKYGLNTPIADPKLARIQAELGSFAALNPAMHGSRGLAAIQHFEKLIGGLQQNPDASIEGIRGIIQTAHSINPNVGAQENSAPEGADNEVYVKGKLVGHTVSGKYVPLAGK